MFNIKDDIDLLESYLQAMKDVSIDNVCVLFATQNLLKDYKRLQKKNEEVKEILDINIIRGIVRDGEKVYNEERCIAVVEQLKELFEKEK